MTRTRGQPIPHAQTAAAQELPSLSRLVPPDTAALLLGTTAKALRIARQQRTGPFGLLRYYKFAYRTVKYDIEDLRAVREQCRVEPKAPDR